MEQKNATIGNIQNEVYCRHADNKRCEKVSNLENGHVDLMIAVNDSSYLFQLEMRDDWKTGRWMTED